MEDLLIIHSYILAYILATSRHLADKVYRPLLVSNPGRQTATIDGLENKLANSISENNGLKLHLKQCITNEKEQALQKIEALELACHKKDMELKNANSTLEKLQAKV